MRRLLRDQNARVGFQGSAGERVSVGLAEVEFAEPDGLAIVSVLRDSDGSVLASGTLTGAGGNLDLDPLPETGAYTVLTTPRTRPG